MQSYFAKARVQNILELKAPSSEASSGAIKDQEHRKNTHTISIIPVGEPEDKKVQ